MSKHKNVSILDLVPPEALKAMPDLFREIMETEMNQQVLFEEEDYENVSALKSFNPPHVVLSNNALQLIITEMLDAVKASRVNMWQVFDWSRE